MRYFIRLKYKKYDLWKGGQNIGYTQTCVLLKKGKEDGLNRVDEIFLGQFRSNQKRTVDITDRDGWEKLVDDSGTFSYTSIPDKYYFYTIYDLYLIY